MKNNRPEIESDLISYISQEITKEELLDNLAEYCLKYHYRFAEVIQLIQQHLDLNDGTDILNDLLPVYEKKYHNY